MRLLFHFGILGIILMATLTVGCLTIASGTFPLFAYSGLELRDWFVRAVLHFRLIPFPVPVLGVLLPCARFGRRRRIDLDIEGPLFGFRERLFLAILTSDRWIRALLGRLTLRPIPVPIEFVIFGAWPHIRRRIIDADELVIGLFFVALPAVEWLP